LPVPASLLRLLPKGDLHSHIDGSIPPKELFAIARRNRRSVLTLSGKELRTPEELVAHVVGSGYRGMLDDIVNRFHPIVGLMQTEQVLKDVGLAYVRELRKHNVVYAEGRFAPQYHTAEGLTHGQAIAAMAEGLDEGGEKYGVTANLIVAIGREADPGTGEAVAEAAARSRRAVALDLGGPERLNPPEKFSEAFRLASSEGLKRTVHAGEGAGSVSQNLRNIRTSIEVLGAQRVGHAIGISRQPALVRLAIEKGVALEMNPVSNLVLGNIRNMEQLGIDRLLLSGVKVTVNSDDPALWPGGAVENVLSKVCRSYGFGLRQLDSLVTNSFSCSFISEREKQALLNEYAEARRRLA
jgi:adenosine deaminase